MVVGGGEGDNFLELASTSWDYSHRAILRMDELILEQDASLDDDDLAEEYT